MRSELSDYSWTAADSARVMFADGPGEQSVIVEFGTTVTKHGFTLRLGS